MAEAEMPLDESRRPQMYPTLTQAEIARLARFGEPRAYADGEALVRVGDPGFGLSLILSGQVAVTHPDDAGRPRLLVTHGPGSIMGELAQLSGRPSLVNGHAVGPVETISIPPARLRALLIGEAEIGQLLRNPGEGELARCLGLVGPIDPNRVYDVAVVGAGRRALPRPARGLGLVLCGRTVPRTSRPDAATGADSEVRMTSKHRGHA